MGLFNDTTYFYVVRSVNERGVESIDSPEAGATPSTANGTTPVTILTVTRVAGDIRLEWTPITNEPPVNHYNVYRHDGPIHDADVGARIHLYDFAVEGFYVDRNEALFGRPGRFYEIRTQDIEGAQATE